MASQSFQENITEVISIARSYVNARIELLKLTLLEKMSLAGAFFLSSVIIVLIIAFCLLFISLAFAHWYAQRTGDIAAGYLITAGFYLVVGIMFLLARRYLITRPVIRTLSSIIFKNCKYEEPAGDEKKDL